MLFRDIDFLYALTCTLFQQLLLALSTYHIALAGAALTNEDNDRVLIHISLFFVFALMAYVTSAGAALLATRAANNIWRNYSNSILLATTESLQYASEKNRNTIVQWIGSEALATLAHACNFHLEMFSVCMNIVFTLAVFYIAAGMEIAATIAASFAISFTLIMLLRRTIEISAGKMQQRRLGMLLSIGPTWNSALFGNRNMRDSGFRQLTAKMQLYFSEINKYMMLEQVVACCPIIISTLALLAVLQFSDFITASLAGALVALLPRSLQVLGNVHALSVCLSQFFLVKAKLRNLADFTEGLEKYQKMHEAPLQSVRVWDTVAQQQITPGDLIKKLSGMARGRYRVTGENGSGKSTLLKIVKDQVADAILITPETRFLESSNELSTGQDRIREIMNVLSMSPPILMLDEWDANLDEENSRRIDQLLEEASKRMIIIEVRHLRQGGVE